MVQPPTKPSMTVTYLYQI